MTAMAQESVVPSEYFSFGITLVALPLKALFGMVSIANY